MHCLSPSTQVRQGTGWIFRDDSSQKRTVAGTPLVVQWLRLHAPNTGGLGSIPVWGTRSHMQQLKMLHIYDTVQPKTKPNKKQTRIKQVPYCSYFNGIFYWSQEIGKGLYCLIPTWVPAKGISSSQTQLERLRRAAQKTREHSGSNREAGLSSSCHISPLPPPALFFFFLLKKPSKEEKRELKAMKELLSSALTGPARLTHKAQSRRGSRCRTEGRPAPVLRREGAGEGLRSRV